MTHPFHPLRGQEFELIERSSIRGEQWVHYTDSDGTLRGIREAWTSAGAEDAFVKVAAGRSAFRVSDLLALASLLDGLDGDERAAGQADGEVGTVKEILSHV